MKKFSYYPVSKVRRTINHIPKINVVSENKAWVSWSECNQKCTRTFDLFIRDENKREVKEISREWRNTLIESQLAFDNTTFNFYHRWHRKEFEILQKLNNIKISPEISKSTFLYKILARRTASNFEHSIQRFSTRTLKEKQFRTNTWKKSIKRSIREFRGIPKYINQKNIDSLDLWKLCFDYIITSNSFNHPFNFKVRIINSVAQRITKEYDV